MHMSGQSRRIVTTKYYGWWKYEISVDMIFCSRMAPKTGENSFAELNKIKANRCLQTNWLNLIPELVHGLVVLFQVEWHGWHGCVFTATWRCDVIGLCAFGASTLERCWRCSQTRRQGTQRKHRKEDGKKQKSNATTTSSQNDHCQTL